MGLRKWARRTRCAPGPKDVGLHARSERRCGGQDETGRTKKTEPESAEAVTTPEVVKCSDGHFRRVIYGIGPYITDYPEQALLASIVQGWCAM